MGELPPLVARATELAERMRFTRSCIPEVGRLLHVLASERGRGRVAEIGAGCGVGTAWIAAGLPPEVPLFTAELDSERAAAVRELFAGDPDVHVLEGDWAAVLEPEAPFDLLFLDSAAAKQQPERVLALLAPRGTTVLDDLTPGRPVDGDPIREFWLRRPELAATELLTTPASAAIVAVRAF